MALLSADLPRGGWPIGPPRRALSRVGAPARSAPQGGDSALLLAAGLPLGAPSTKRLGRIGPCGGRCFGWDFVHVGIDNVARLAFAKELRDECGETAAASLARPGLLRRRGHRCPTSADRQRRAAALTSLSISWHGRLSLSRLHPTLLSPARRRGGGFCDDRSLRWAHRRPLRHHRRTHRRPTGLLNRYDGHGPTTGWSQQTDGMRWNGFRPSTRLWRRVARLGGRRD